jgi:cytochrome bd-type quinol oxidase subunit 1
MNHLKLQIQVIEKNMINKYVNILAFIGMILLSNSMVVLIVSVIYRFEYNVTSPLVITILYYYLFCIGLILLFVFCLLILFNWYFKQRYSDDRKRFKFK